jgi:hypothetical protein
MDIEIKMKKTILFVSTSLLLFSSATYASPLISQWAGSGADADKYFCKYGDGEIKVIYGTTNCPLSN